MTDKIRFTKMHGAGNDYIYVNTFLYPISNPEELAVKWSAWHTGIGSDGLVLIGPSDKADFSMRIFNADGSEAMMCGNASRCIGKYVFDNRLTDKAEVSLETKAGIKYLKLHIKEDKVNFVTVDMGVPEVIAQRVANEGPVAGTAISMGNPHLVLLVDDLESLDVKGVGSRLEYHPLFPDRVNVEFASLMQEGTMRMWVWERGSGVTMACGTGACATAVAAVVNGLSGRKSRVIMDGGVLDIVWSETDNHVYMTGEAVTVFDGEIEL